VSGAGGHRPGAPAGASGRASARTVPRMGARSIVLALALAAALTGCGGDGGGDAGAEESLRTPWVDPDGDPPYIGALSVNPADGALFLASNTGLFRIDEAGGEPVKVTGVLRTPDGEGQVSEALVVDFTGPDELLGSGHPAAGSSLPPVLGLIRSGDAGKTWTPVSELGTADFHVLARSGDSLVAPMFGQAQIFLSRDEGRSWETRVAPMPLVDLAVDPRDSKRWVGTSDQGVFTSGDEGKTWRQRDPTPNVRLAWKAPRELYRIDPGGPVKVSADGGETWKDRGDAGGEPQVLSLDGDGALYMASLDGTVKRSDDGAATWEVVVAAR
jgi:photosystem II stability/assembly factor-like uncharacterized protein